MKVSQLRELLSGVDGDLEVWLQKDPEGNGFESAAGVEVALRVEEGFMGRTPDFPAHEDFENGEYDRASASECFLIFP